MKLLEYQVKNYFRTYGIPVPHGKTASSSREVKDIAEEIGKPVVIKAQVRLAGRGEKGGIQVAKSPVEAEQVASQMLATKISGLSVNKVQVDEALAIATEYYVVLTLDRATRMPQLMMYRKNSISVESAGNALWDSIDRVEIDPLIGLQRFQVRRLASLTNFPQVHLNVLVTICLNMWRMFVDLDARLVALSPLVVTEHQRVIALDGKITLDPCAAYRQAQIFDYVKRSRMSEKELEASKQDFDFLELGTPGSIACLVNGAGLALATMDQVVKAGGHVADLVDIGARAVNNHSYHALSILLSDPNVKAVIVNTIAGITSCVEIAESLLEAWENSSRKIPVFVYFIGSDKMEANSILQNSGMIVSASLEDAIQSAVALTKEG